MSAWVGFGDATYSDWVWVYGCIDVCGCLDSQPDGTMHIDWVWVRVLCVSGWTYVYFYVRADVWVYVNVWVYGCIDLCGCLCGCMGVWDATHSDVGV